MNKTIAEAIINQLLNDIENGTAKEKACATKALTNSTAFKKIYDIVVK